MRQQRRAYASRISQWLPITFTSFWFIFLATTAASGQKPDSSQSLWQATIRCDSATVYSGMSVDSSRLRSLKTGEVVIIDLEVIGADGAWCLVRERGQRKRLGYVQSECLEWDRPLPMLSRQVESPAARPAAPSDTESLPRAEATASKRSSREEMEKEVERAVDARLSSLLRMNQPNDTAPPEPVGFDEWGEFFLPFQPTKFAHRRPSFFLPNGSFFHPLGRPAIPVTSSGPFCNSLNRPAPSAAFGVQITGGSPSRRR